MQLSPERTARFYRNWFELLYFVIEQLHLVPAFSATEERNELLPLSDEMQLRNELWDDDTPRERFITTNPASLPAPYLAVVASWLYRRAGSFYILCTLKKYTFFLSDEEPQRAFYVLGLPYPIEEMAKPPLPVYMQAVLLTIENQII